MCSKMRFQMTTFSIRLVTALIRTLVHFPHLRAVSFTRLTPRHRDFFRPEHFVPSVQFFLHFTPANMDRHHRNFPILFTRLFFTLFLARSRRLFPVVFFVFFRTCPRVDVVFRLVLRVGGNFGHRFLFDLFQVRENPADHVAGFRFGYIVVSF